MPFSRGEALEEGVDQERDVLLALAQRRHGDVDDVQAVEEVVAEFALAHQFLEVLVGGGDEADVGLDGLVAADALEDAGIEHAQDFDLGVGVDLADLVEEERAAVGLLEAADAALDGAGERAFFVAEEFALEQLRRRAPRNGRRRIWPCSGC